MIIVLIGLDYQSATDFERFRRLLSLTTDERTDDERSGYDDNDVATLRGSALADAVLNQLATTLGLDPRDTTGSENRASKLNWNTA